MEETREDRLAKLQAKKEEYTVLKEIQELEQDKDAERV